MKQFIRRNRRWALLLLAVAAAVFAMFGLDKLVCAGEIAPHSRPFDGVAPFATSREEAMRNRINAFMALEPPIDFSARIVVQLLGATENPGRMIKLTAGEPLWAMVSGNGQVLPGYPIPEESSIPAESWKVSIPLAGQTIYVFLVSLPEQHFYAWGFEVAYTALACSSIPDERIPTIVARRATT